MNLAQLIANGASEQEIRDAGGTDADIAAAKANREKLDGEKQLAEQVGKIVADKLAELKAKAPQREAIFGNGNHDHGKAVTGKAKKQVADFFRAWKSGDVAKMSSISSEIANEFKGLSEGVGGDGGFFVHPEFHKEVLRLTEEYGVARKFFRVLPMSSDSKNISALTGKVAAQMVGEASATSGDVKPSVGNIELIAKKAMANIIGTSELIEDNSTDEEIWALMAEKLGEAFGLLEDQQCFLGSGSGNNHTGLLVESGAGVVVMTMATGKDTFAEATADDLLKMQTAVPTSVRRRGVYVMHPSVLDHFRGLKDSEGRYIVQQPAGDKPTTLWNKPVMECDAFPAMSDSAVSKKFVVFGDGKSAGVIGDRRRTRLKKLTEGTVNGVNLADTDQEALQATTRFAFKTALGAAVCVLRTAAE